MRWSKLKYLVEEQFADSIKVRVSINSTAYGNCSCGHAWITLDKEIVANFCTMAFWNRANGYLYRKDNRWVSDSPIPEHILEVQKKSYGEMEYGELSRQDAYQSCWEFVHELTIDKSIASDDPLIQSLAMLDKRLGKRKLKALDDSNLHPLAKKLYSVRLESEGMRPVCTESGNRTF